MRFRLDFELHSFDESIIEARCILIYIFRHQATRRPLACPRLSKCRSPASPPGVPRLAVCQPLPPRHRHTKVSRSIYTHTYNYLLFIFYQPGRKMPCPRAALKYHAPLPSWVGDILRQEEYLLCIEAIAMAAASHRAKVTVYTFSFLPTFLFGLKFQVDIIIADILL